MTRILYFSRDYTPHDWRFLDALSRTANEVAYLRFENRSLKFEQQPLPDSVRAIEWAGGRGPVDFADVPSLVSDLRRVFQDWQPDLIHAGTIQTAAYLVALTGFQPLVSMSWGYDLLQEADRSLELRQATTFTLQNSSVLVCDCQTVREKAITLGMPAGRIVTFPWGVDLERFSPGDARISSDQPFTVLSTRAWEPIYGVDILAQAFTEAAQQCSQLRLCMIGNGSMASQLRSIFYKGGVIDQVEFPGQVGQADLPDYYRSADLYVSASHTDGSSVSLLEALACGTPALVSDIPGNREWVEPGVQGWRFPDGDVDALAEGILQAFEDRKRLLEMGQAARRLAEARADWKKNFNELLRAYELALAADPEPQRDRER